jgi:hypothetical protein
MSRFTESLLTPSCGLGGGEAFWQIEQPVAAPGRNFVVSTIGSSFIPMVSVWEGGCSNLTPVACSTTTSISGSATNALQFTTDGSNTFLIVIEGLNGAIGNLKLKVVSF